MTGELELGNIAGSTLSDSNSMGTIADSSLVAGSNSMGIIVQGISACKDGGNSSKGSSIIVINAADLNEDAMDSVGLQSSSMHDSLYSSYEF